jgi:[ribosomal protein S5]-alanine N-acetyltransferase
MQPPETFSTTRLLLRPPVRADAEAIFRAYAHDPEVTRYLIWRPHADVETTYAFVDHCLTAWREHTSFSWIITWRTTGQLLGMISLRIKGFEAVLGYGLARAVWGQGIMPEAAHTLVEWALAQPPIYRVWAVCDWENRASARVMEKIGMQCEGLLRRGVLHPNVSDEPRDCWLYAKVK